MGNVYVLAEECDHQIMENDTGADLAQEDFAIIGSIPCVADNAIAIGAFGSFHVEPFLTIRTDELKSGEDTFDTENSLVYWDDTNKVFSDTETADYYIVGQLKYAKGTNDYITFVKFPTAELVVT